MHEAGLSPRVVHAIARDVGDQIDEEAAAEKPTLLEQQLRASLRVVGK
jgi:hypothetical protein